MDAICPGISAAVAEGDSIRRLADRLHGAFAGHDVVAAQYRRAGDLPVRFAGDRLVECAAVGKHLLMRFGSDRTLHSHLRMQGSWRQHRAGWRPGLRQDRVGAWFDFGAAGVLAAHDVPVLEVVATARERTVVGHLGPDILAEDFPRHRDRVIGIIGAQPGRLIREALLDQRNLCGIGNLWAVESLFVAGIWPHTPVARADVGKAVDVAHRMMRLGLSQGHQVTTGNRRRGETHWVYGRYRRPCRRCGTPVAFQPAGAGPYDRETWWCPHCQPA